MKCHSNCFALIGFAAVLSLGCLLSGCSNNPVGIKEEVVPAAGTISYQGQPLDHFQLLLYPSDKRRPAAGLTDAEGRFTFGTNAAGDGAPPGTHKLVITYVGPPVQQESGKEEPYTPPPPKIKVPEKYGSAETSDLTLTIPSAGSTTLAVDLK